MNIDKYTNDNLWKRNKALPYDEYIMHRMRSRPYMPYDGRWNAVISVREFCNFIFNGNADADVKRNLDGV